MWSLKQTQKTEGSANLKDLIWANKQKGTQRDSINETPSLTHLFRTGFYSKYWLLFGELKAREEKPERADTWPTEVFWTFLLSA